MTTRRVLFNSGSASPFRVAVGGVDAAGASWETLIFDANQPPLRVYLNSWMQVGFGSTGDFIRWAYGPAYPTPPAGENPMFSVMWYQPSNLGPGAVRGRSPYGTGPCFTNDNTNGQGGGGAVGVGSFMGITFVHEFTNTAGTFTYPAPTRIGFVLFRNTL
jgi:hypothetical protein